MERPAFAHLRPYWWVYGAASAAEVLMVAATMYAAFNSEADSFPAPLLWLGVAALGVCGLIQSVSLVVVCRLPPREPMLGEPTMRGSIAVGVLMFALFLNPFSLLILALASGGFLALVLMMVVPIAVLSSMYGDVMEDD